MRKALGSNPSVSNFATGMCALQMCMWPPHTAPRRAMRAHPSPATRCGDGGERVCARPEGPCAKTFKGTWCSGMTSASHAEGPGFNPQCVQLWFPSSRAYPLCGRGLGEFAPLCSYITRVCLASIADICAQPGDKPRIHWARGLMSQGTRVPRGWRACGIEKRLCHSGLSDTW